MASGTPSMTALMYRRNIVELRFWEYLVTICYSLFYVAYFLIDIRCFHIVLDAHRTGLEQLP